MGRTCCAIDVRPGTLARVAQIVASARARGRTYTYIYPRSTTHAPWTFPSHILIQQSRYHGYDLRVPHSGINRSHRPSLHRIRRRVWRTFLLSRSLLKQREIVCTRCDAGRHLPRAPQTSENINVEALLGWRATGHGPGGLAMIRPVS